MAQMISMDGTPFGNNFYGHGLGCVLPADHGAEPQRFCASFSSPEYGQMWSSRCNKISNQVGGASEGTFTHPGMVPAQVVPPSRGSKSHHKGQCNPCRMVHTTQGCKDGAMCNFCHFEHDQSAQVPPPPRALANKHASKAKGNKKKPSKGSKNHHKGMCRPCRNFNTPEGCSQGYNCNFCHCYHEEPSEKALSTKEPSEISEEQLSYSLDIDHTDHATVDQAWPLNDDEAAMYLPAFLREPNDFELTHELAQVQGPEIWQMPGVAAYLNDINTSRTDIIIGPLQSL
eukprot:gb/GFBE01082991.1/.p1 GENE.gb/GFBE01082991.1/~~gb/GFBE01082991.1/.p1  ORF type:complete len:286 (+),score=54.63 gb/GFBE01082991.1/:1-858(+)